MRNLIILGAAGRDFHDFNVHWRRREDVRVVAFTANQIPDIQGRTYPAELCGPKYPRGIPIYAEAELPRLIGELRADLCTLAYSDLAHEEVMHKAALCNAAGAEFTLLSPLRTMLPASKPVVAVCAVRTGCGKSQTSRFVAAELKKLGLRVAVVRHPMPYGDLRLQICQRFADVSDLDTHACTIEEREEYEPHLRAGNVVFAGIDYERILEQATREADVILWDGGNNDTPFVRPSLHIVVADPHRPGHELRYYPGETNLRMADVLVINKVCTARPQDVAFVQQSAQRVNPRAEIVLAESPVVVAEGERLRGKRVLVIEDGPTVTHGEMPFGAGMVAARRFGGTPIDPRPYAVGGIRETFEHYPHLTQVLPAMGYGRRQIRELQETIERAECDLVLIGTPIDLTRVLTINKPALRAAYELVEREPGRLAARIAAAVRAQGA